MTSKERILAVFRNETTDYAPCMPIFWSSPDVDGYRWSSDEERLAVAIDVLGVDAFLQFTIPVARQRDVTERTWTEEVPGESYPVLNKRIETARGTLTAAVRMTEDWPHGMDIPLMSDFSVSRFVKPWIETEADLDYFELVWQPPDLTLDQLLAAISSTRELADRRQVPICGFAGLGLTLSLSLFGTENAVYYSIERPVMLDRMAEIDHQMTMRRIELCVEAGVDYVSRNGFYETTDFWSPAQIERFLSKRLRREIETAHQAGLPISYTVCTGIMPILEHLRGLDFDCLFGIEPVLGDQNMAAIARELGGKCIWGGVSAPYHIGEGDPAIVRKAVRDFYSNFGKTGTILAPVPSIRPHWPWENTLAMIDEWKALTRAC